MATPYTTYYGVSGSSAYDLRTVSLRPKTLDPWATRVANYSVVGPPTSGAATVCSDESDATYFQLLMATGADAPFTSEMRAHFAPDQSVGYNAGDSTYTGPVRVQDDIVSVQLKVRFRFINGWSPVAPYAGSIRTLQALVKNGSYSLGNAPFGVPSQGTDWQEIIFNLTNPGATYPLYLMHLGGSDVFSGLWEIDLTPFTSWSSGSPDPANLHASDVQISRVEAILSVTNNNTPPVDIFETLDGSDAGTSSGADVRLSSLPVEGPEQAMTMSLVTPAAAPRLYERYAVFTNESYVIIQGRAERAPMLGALGHTITKASSYSVTENLDEALSIDIGATRRWLADATKVVAAPEYGSGWTKWVPTVGSASIVFKFEPGKSPIIDPEYDYESRIGDIIRPAMIFPGVMWAQTSAPMSNGDEWGLAMVCVIHENTVSTTAYLLNSFQNDLANPNSAVAERLGKKDLTIAITGDNIMCATGGRQTYDKIQSISDRPIIVVASGKANRTRLLVIDRKYATHYFTHPDVGPTDMRFLLGRPARPISDLRGSARMDLMEISFFSHFLAAKEMWTVANMLDSIYGASQ
jgi:hypothetical protein